ncbi:MAG: hypothetical protein IJZ85_13745 [Lachnospiraceae bacterium]|nr:hypothetical protein [Lachnospiraceae bacterium]
MTARERMLALRLLEKQEKNPEYAKKLGVQVKVNKKMGRSKDGGVVNV